MWAPQEDEEPLSGLGRSGISGKIMPGMGAKGVSAGDVHDRIDGMLFEFDQMRSSERVLHVSMLATARKVDQPRPRLQPYHSHSHLQPEVHAEVKERYLYL